MGSAGEYQKRAEQCAERALLVLAEHVDRSRYQPIAIVGTDGELAEELRSHGIRTFHVPIVYSGARRMPAWGVTVARLAWILRREGAAIVHAASRSMGGRDRRLAASHASQRGIAPGVGKIAELALDDGCRNRAGMADVSGQF